MSAYTAILDAIRNAFPNPPKGKDEYNERRKFIETELAPALLGPPPEWSKAVGYQLGRGAIFNAGAFCVYWGKDPDSGECLALVHVRKEKDADGNHKLGAVGGYTEKPEQSFVGVLREGIEEICDPDGKPVITPDVSQHVIILEGKDYLSKDPPVQYVGYACELDEKDMRKLKDYIRNCEDPNYQAQVTVASHGETVGARLMPLSEIVTMQPDRFTYHRQYDVYREVAGRLGIGGEQHKPSSSVGYAFGDSPQVFMSRIARDGDGKQTATYRAF